MPRSSRGALPRFLKRKEAINLGINLETGLSREAIPFPPPDFVAIAGRMPLAGPR
jgi:hypothetical protein